MTWVKLFLAGHTIALIFGVLGILIALPNPQLWAADENARLVFAFGMQWGGASQIVLGFAAMLAYGFVTVGKRRTAIFLGAAVVISLTYELLGTGTGWPFGAYSYTDGLGPRVMDRVPATIPLSWFYMGFACYLLAQMVVTRFRPPWAAAVTVVLGAWLLTGWDTVLDPAMAHEDMPLKFWVWHETGPYFGMPAKNFAGWVATGLTFMAVARFFWRGGVDISPRQAAIPGFVLALNLVWAAVLSSHVGLWAPLLVTLTVGMAPLTLALVFWRWARPSPAFESSSDIVEPSAG